MMLDEDDGLLMHSVPYWHFWNPGSGLVGGVIAAAVVAALIFIFGRV